MSMIGNFLRITAAELNALLKKPETIRDFVYAAELQPKPGRALDIGNAWDGLKDALIRAGGEKTTLVFGANQLIGIEEGGPDADPKACALYDLGYGAARYVTPTQVKSLHALLKSISSDKLKVIKDAEYIQAEFINVRAFYAAADAGGDAMLFYIN